MFLKDCRVINAKIQRDIFYASQFFRFLSDWPLHFLKLGENTYSPLKKLLTVSNNVVNKKHHGLIISCLAPFDRLNN